MDGLFHEKPYEQMDDLGGFPIFLVQHPFVYKLDIPRHPIMQSLMENESV